MCLCYESAIFSRKKLPFISKESIHTTQDKKRFTKNNTVVYSKRTYCASLVIFNKLQNCIKDLRFSLFKTKLKIFSLDKQFYFVNDFF